MNLFFFDLETYSETPIKHGTYRYAAECEMMIATYATNDAPVSCVDMTAGESMAQCLEEFYAADKIIAHKADFDRNVLAMHEHERPIELWHCTMAQAYAHSLPGALAKLCALYKVPEEMAKDEEGGKLIQLFCKPRPKNSKLRRATRDTHPDEWERFKEYAMSDIRAMRYLYHKMPKWNYSDFELGLWHLDQRINDRGIYVDQDLATAALQVVERSKKVMDKRTKTLTDNELESTTKRDQLLKLLLSMFGIDLPDCRAATIERRLEDDELPDPVKELLRIRLASGRTSATKYKALLNGVSEDGRLRGLLQFCGAQRTGRWAGRIYQPQNLPRTPMYLKGKMNEAINSILGGWCDLVYGNPIEVCGAATRGALIAAPGKKIVAADLANIEGRGLAWLAGEWWKVKAFEAFDNGAGIDIYVLAYANAFGIDPDVVLADEAAGGVMRLVGKIMELALGYQGAVGAFTLMMAIYGLEMTEERILQVVRAWRRSNAAIVQMWYDVEDTCKQAIRLPGQTFTCGRLKIRRDKGWLKIRLPSGRLLCYPFVKLVKNKITYMGMNQYTRRWERLSTYGGKLVENITQAFARDVLAYNMPHVEAHGYEIIITVHDEPVTETPDDDRYSADELSKLITRVPPWAEGLPLAASGYEAYRYRKG